MSDTNKRLSALDTSFSRNLCAFLLNHPPFAQEERKPWHAQERFQEEEKFKAWLADEEAGRERERIELFFFFLSLL